MMMPLADDDKVLAIDPTIVDALNSKAFALVNLDKNEESFSIY